MDLYLIIFFINFFNNFVFNFKTCFSSHFMDFFFLIFVKVVQQQRITLKIEIINKKIIVINIFYMYLFKLFFIIYINNKQVHDLFSRLRFIISILLK